MAQLIWILTGSALASAGMTYIALRILRARGVMDEPNQRSSHAAPTPRGGGIGPVLVIVAGLLLLDQRQEVLVLAVLWLAAISLLDDLYDISWIVRLGGQATAIAALLFLTPLPPLFLNADLLILDRLIVGLFWLWFVNLYNFMDGIDGLAGSEAVAIGLGCSAVLAGLGIAGEELALPALIAGAAAGFLVWNWPPARLFMGDVGSVTLGFVAGYALLRLAAAGGLAAAFILPGYFLVDATWTLLRRLSRREPVWRAHRQHAYQQAVQAGWSHGRTITVIAAGNVGLMGLAVWSLGQPLAAIAAAAALCAGLRGYLASRVA